MKKSPNDTKQYKTITLANGLRILLVHNAESNKSAAALAVNVGHFDDPNHRQGLAHFLEQKTFLTAVNIKNLLVSMAAVIMHGRQPNIPAFSLILVINTLTPR